MKTTENQGRVRNCSADSGCDVDLQEDEFSCQMLEENLNLWTSILESLLKQKLEKVKADLKLSFRGKMKKIVNCCGHCGGFLINLIYTTAILRERKGTKTID